MTIEELMKIPKSNRDFDTRLVKVEACKGCGHLLRLVSQADDSPEYYSQVFVVCECGELVSFSVPVN